MASKPRPGRRLLLILAVIVLLPALFYSAYEISTLSMNERVMAALYARQVDFILFSMNQHLWDMANIHAGSVNGLFEEPVGSRQFKSALQRFLQRNPVIDAIVVTDTLGHRPTLFSLGASGALRLRIEDVLRRNGEVVERVYRYKQLEYRRMVSIALGDSASPNDTLLLIFPLESERFGPRLGGLVVNETAFIQRVLGPRLDGGCRRGVFRRCLEGATRFHRVLDRQRFSGESEAAAESLAPPRILVGDCHPRAHSRGTGPLPLFTESGAYPSP